MKNEAKSQKKLTLTLVAGILMLAAGLAMIIAGFIINLKMKNAFVKTEDVPKYVPGWYIYCLEIGGAAVFLGSFGNLYSYLQWKFNWKRMNIKQMCIIGIFSALSVVLYYFGKFNLPFFPSWLDIQFSDLPILIVSFMYGPLSGVIMVFVRFFCKLPGTSTVGVGELADVIIGITLVLVSGFIYRKHRTFKGALCAMAIGMGAATVAACIANWLILIPAYVKLAHFPWAALVGAMNSYMNGVVTEDNFMLYYIFVGVLPFNLFRYALVFVVTLLIYKRLHILIEMFTNEKKIDMDQDTEEDTEEV